MKKVVKVVIIKLWIIVLLLLKVTEGYCQYNNNYWVFGDSAGIDWSSSTPTLFVSSAKYWRGSASIGNSSGLLSYAIKHDFTFPMNGKVWNKYHIQMQNGEFVYGNGWYHDRMFLPVPGSDSLLYLISCCVTSSCPYGLYYTLIDLSANNDSGAVIQKNVPLNSYPAFDGLMAVQHGNGRDWWILFQRWDGAGAVSFNDIFVYLVDPSGITLHSQVNIGAGHSTGGGHLRFSTNGNNFCVVSWEDLIQLYNFNRCSGNISLWETLRTEYTTTPSQFITMSSAFSNSNNRLYVVEHSLNSNLSRLIQYDLTVPNIASSRDTIYTVPSNDNGIADLMLAPNGKIYLSAADEPLMTLLYPDSAYTTINNNLSVINYPDSLGAACDFQPFSFNLGAGRTYYGLPNNPDYELGAWVGSPCDTLSVGLNPNPIPEASWMQAWYNHEWNMIHVNASKLQGKKGMLRLFDMEGRIVFEKPAEVIAGGYYTTEINMENLASGVYVVNLVTEQDKISEKVVKY